MKSLALLSVQNSLGPFLIPRLNLQRVTLLNDKSPSGWCLVSLTWEGGRNSEEKKINAYIHLSLCLFPEVAWKFQNVQALIDNDTLHTGTYFIAKILEKKLQM